MTEEIKYEKKKDNRNIMENIDQEYVFEVEFENLVKEIIEKKSNKRKFILIRGHQGSGKSTLADNLQKYFSSKDLTSILLERDQYFVENGEYKWSADRFSDADKWLNQQIEDSLNGKIKIEKEQKFNLSLSTKDENKKEVKPDIIILTGTNAKISHVDNYKNFINSFNKKNKKENHVSFDVLRMNNLFKNIHNVPLDRVIEVINATQDYKGEINIKPLENNKNDLDLLNKIREISKNNIEFDKQKNTYINSDYIKFNKNKLFIMKKSNLYPSLNILKYKNSVFYENNFDDALLEMRGTVVDDNNNIIIRPFKKVFNYSEMIDDKAKYKSNLKPDTLVYGVVKINGYLGNATYIDLSKRKNLNLISDGENNSNTYTSNLHDKSIVYSTTGSLDSSYAVMTKEHLSKYEQIFKDYPNHTFAFEIIDERDPHIIKEKNEDVFIGLINVETGYQFKEHELDEIANKYGLIRPQTTQLMKFSEMLSLLKEVKHEGFMVFNENHELECKLKSPFYLVSKFIARNIKNLDEKLKKGKNVFDEEYYPLIEHLTKDDIKENFKILNEQERIKYIQNFINNQSSYEPQNNEKKLIKNKRKMKL